MRAFTFIFMLLLGVLSGKDTLVLGDVPLAPEGGIYDPDQWLTGDSRSEIARNISIAKAKWKAEVFVIVFSRTPEIDEAALAKKAAGKWGSGRLWGVVMHVVGDPDTPLIFTGRKGDFGWSKEQEDNFDLSLEKALEEVKGRTFREEDQRFQVQTGTRESCEELGYLGLVMARIDSRYDSARGDNMKVIQKKQTDRSFLKKLVMILVPLTLLILAIMVYLIRRKRSESRSDFFFPETSPRRRFLAPWSGGADVIVKVGSRLREDGSRKG